MQHFINTEDMDHIKITDDKEILDFLTVKKHQEKDVYIRYYNHSRCRYVSRKIDLSQPVTVNYAGTTGNKLFHYYDSWNTGWRNAIINQYVYLISDK